jgi:GNAT superfamily N-acetyltransferase
VTDDPGSPSGLITIRALDPPAYRAAIPGLAALVVDAVEGGASVNFLAGVTHAEAAAWWSTRSADIEAGRTTAFVAIDSRARSSTSVGRDVDREPGASDREPGAGAIVGSTLLIRSPNANSPHRAEIGKVLVHRSARRLGVGRALMAAAETRARADGRWLLILDTEAGSAADAFYRELGWQVLGTMPNHAYRSDGVLAPTTYFWKDLRA